MTIEKIANGGELTLKLAGRLDTSTAPRLEADLTGSMEGVTRLVLDFAALEYISSAGLRVILQIRKTMDGQGEMIIRNVNETVAEVFEVTGFADFLTIE